MELLRIPEGPFVFVSFSWRDEAHVQWVHSEVYPYLKNALGPDIEVVLDVNEDDMLNLQLNHGSVADWMLRACAEAAVVVVVCSPGYKASTEITEGRSAVYLEYQRGILPRLREPMLYVTLVYDQACGLEIPSITPDDLGRAFFALPFQSERKKIARFVREAVRSRALPAGSPPTIPKEIARFVREAVRSRALPAGSPPTIPKKIARFVREAVRSRALPAGSRPTIPPLGVRPDPEPRGEPLALRETASVTLAALREASSRGEYLPQEMADLSRAAQARVLVEVIETWRWPWGPKQPRLVHKEYDVEDVVSAVKSYPGQRILLLGDPGSGKSTAMRKLAREHLAAWTEAGSVAPDGPPFPIFIDLAALPPNANLADYRYIKDCAVPDQVGAHMPSVAETLTQLLDPQVPLPADFPRLLLLIDSFDEAAVVRLYNAQGYLMDGISEFYNQLEARVDKVTVVVAMRTQYEPHDLDPRWARFTLVGLNDRAQRQKIEACLEPEHHRDALLEELATNRELRQIAGNPLMLDLIIQYWRAVPAPPRQVGYLQVYDVLQIRDSPEVRKYGRGRLQLLAKAVAYVLMFTDTRSIWELFRHMTVLAVDIRGADLPEPIFPPPGVSFSVSFSDFNTFEHGLELLDAMSLVTIGPVSSVKPRSRFTRTKLTRRNWRTDRRPIRFVHRRVLEFFAARFFVEHFKARTISKKELIPSLESSSWREVLVQAMQVGPVEALGPFVMPLVATLRLVTADAVTGLVRTHQSLNDAGESAVYQIFDLINQGFRGRRRSFTDHGGEDIQDMLAEYDRVLEIILESSDLLVQRRYLRFVSFLSRDLPLTPADDATHGVDEFHHSHCVSTILKYLVHPSDLLRFEALHTLSSLDCPLSMTEFKDFKNVVPEVFRRLREFSPERATAIEPNLRSVLNGHVVLEPRLRYGQIIRDLVRGVGASGDWSISLTSATVIIPIFLMLHGLLSRSGQIDDEWFARFLAIPVILLAVGVKIHHRIMSYTLSLVAVCVRFELETQSSGLSMDTIRDLYRKEFDPLGRSTGIRDLDLIILRILRISRGTGAQRYLSCQDEVESGTAKFSPEIEPSELRQWYQHDITAQQQLRLFGVVEAYLAGKMQDSTVNKITSNSEAPEPINSSSGKIGPPPLLVTDATYLAGDLAREIASNPKLISIYLYENRLHKLAVTHLARAIGNSPLLATVFLSRNGLGDHGAQELAKVIASNNTVKSLDLSFNNIGDTGAAKLAQALETNQTLTALNLDGNVIGDIGAGAIAAALEVNLSVTSVGITLFIPSTDPALITTIQNSLTFNQKAHNLVPDFESKKTSHTKATLVIDDAVDTFDEKQFVSVLEEILECDATDIYPVTKEAGSVILALLLAIPVIPQLVSRSATLAEKARVQSISVAGQFYATTLEPTAKRILVVASKWGKSNGGLSAFTMHLVDVLTRQNHDVLVSLPAQDVTYDDIRLEQHGTTKIVYSRQHKPEDEYPSPLSSDQLDIVEEGWRPDIVLGHAHVTGEGAFDQAKGLNCKMMLVMHTLPPSTEIIGAGRTEACQEKARRVADLANSTRCALVVCIGPYLFDEWRGAIRGLNKVKVVGYDPHFNCPPLPDDVTAEPTVKHRAKLSLFLNRMKSERVEGLDLAIDAVLGTNLSLAVCGVTDEDQVFIHSKNEVGDRPIQLHEFIADSDDVRNAVDRSTVVISPCRVGYGQFAHEAMEYGTPAIMPKPSGISQLVETLIANIDTSGFPDPQRAREIAKHLCIPGEKDAFIEALKMVTENESDYVLACGLTKQIVQKLRLNHKSSLRALVGKINGLEWKKAMVRHSVRKGLTSAKSQLTSDKIPPGFAFVSYKWNPPSEKVPKEWVQDTFIPHLKNQVSLREIVCDIDWESVQAQVIETKNEWMARMIREAAIVLVICSPGYLKSTKVACGVRFEYVQILDRLQDPDKPVLPILPEGVVFEESVPRPFHPATIALHYPQQRDDLVALLS